MRDWIGVDSLKFVSLDGLYRAAGEAAGRDADAPRILRRLLLGRLPGRALGQDRGRLPDEGGRVSAGAALPVDAYLAALPPTNATRWQTCAPA